jgi:hypothetical protein
MLRSGRAAGRSVNVAFDRQGAERTRWTPGRGAHAEGQAFQVIVPLRVGGLCVDDRI